MGDQADNQSLQDEQDEQRLPIEKERATEANEIDLTEGRMGDQAGNQSLQDEQDEQSLPIEKKRATEAKEIHLTEENVPCFCSKRWIMGYMGLLLGACIYLLRVDFSMAMVCMVKPTDTAIRNDTNTTSRIYMYNKDERLLDGNITTISDPQESTDCLIDIQAADIAQQSWEFTWTKSFQSLLLSVYYIGCFVSQVPGGWVANRFGGKFIITITLTISCICTFVTPVLARANRYMVLPLRLIMGMCSGPMMPAYYDLIGVWVPPFERSRFTSFMWIGQVFGAILAYSTSGLLCAHAPDNGWPSIFYIHGSVTLSYVLLWQVLIANRPTKHRRISQAELTYIARFVSPKTKQESRVVPWKAILTSRAVWAIYICHICDAWTFFTLLICLPMFLEDVLKVDVQKNGLFSSLPYVTFAVSLFVSGYTADILQSKRILTTTATRRIYQVTAFLGAGVSICLSGFTTCNQHTLVITYICLCNFFVGMGEGAGYAPNPVDIAPKYAGIIFSVSNTLAQIPGFVAPAVVGAMTSNGTTEEWRHVFYICAGLNLLGILVFGSMSSGDVQSWSGTSIEITILPRDQHVDNHTVTLDKKDYSDHVCLNGLENTKEQNRLLSDEKR